MKAAMYYGNQDVRWEDIPEPTTRPQTVKVKVAHNGICGTDVHEYFDGPIWIPATYRHALTNITIPIVLGHEFSGTVVEVGAGVNSIAEGDRVAIEPVFACGTCPLCLEGKYNLCDFSAWFGLSADGGGLSEYVVTDVTRVFKLPSDLSLELGALVEPMSVAYHASRRKAVGRGDTVVVHGGGPIGIGIVLALTAQGVERIIVSEVSPRRREIVRGLKVNSIETVLDPTEGGIVDAIRGLTGGKGADVSFNAAGGPIASDPDGNLCVAFADAIASTKKQGQLVVVATHPATTFEPNVSTFNELDITGSCAYCNDFPPVIASMAAGNYPTDGWVEHYPADGLYDALGALHAGGAPKILVDVASS